MSLKYIYNNTNSLIIQNRRQRTIILLCFGMISHKNQIKMDILHIQPIGTLNMHPYIHRPQGKRRYCHYCFPLDLKPIDNNKKGSYENTQTFQKLLNAYYFFQLAFNHDVMVETYSYISSSEYFKLEQQYYPRVLSSVNPKEIKYQEKLEIITQVAKIVKHFSKESVCLRTLGPHILGYSRADNKTQIKLVWMGHAIKLDAKKKQTKEYLSSADYAEFGVYVAPEIKNSKSYGKKADVWSVGVMFYELLFGNTAEINTKAPFFEIKLPKDTPLWLQKILLCVLEEDPNKRCSIQNFLDYLKPLNCCAEVAWKLLPKDCPM